MKRHKINLLILSDEEMNCDTKNSGLEKMGIENIGFSSLAIQGYDMIIYEGKKGSKILKSKFTKKGEII